MKALFILIGFILSYLIISFIKMDLNFTNWSNELQIFFLFLSAFIIFIEFIIILVREEAKKIEELYK